MYFMVKKKHDLNIPNPTLVVNGNFLTQNLTVSICLKIQCISLDIQQAKGTSPNLKSGLHIEV